MPSSDVEQRLGPDVVSDSKEQLRLGTLDWLRHREMAQMREVNSVQKRNLGEEIASNSDSARELRPNVLAVRP
jgi:hypothetical protein